ncbi:MAG: hypothetical protein UU60_C0021G0002 [Candidatus Uhrbacteria bacterium GW2011_GWB2_41_36]|nr:MAG: hypothetical protein UU60_C0021G0002 [Candidatus Uhrbacteria bacterium GW2011_GWB2_41_36]KKS50295.1 MAG: hypothetical protein UV15_C0023G0002 [Candidatus Uhrbacteria bacterium GW2011_GWA2_42_220]
MLLTSEPSPFLECPKCSEPAADLATRDKHPKQHQYAVHGAYLVQDIIFKLKGTRSKVSIF